MWYKPKYQREPTKKEEDMTLDDLVAVIDDYTEMYRQGEVPCDEHPVQVLTELKDTFLSLAQDLLQPIDVGGTPITAPALP